MTSMLNDDAEDESEGMLDNGDLDADEDEDGYKVILNPPNKADKLKWSRGDAIIVMALE